MGNLTKFLTQDEINFFFDTFPEEKKRKTDSGLLKCPNLLSNIRFLITLKIENKEQINKIWNKSLEIYHNCIIRKMVNIFIKPHREFNMESAYCHETTESVMLISHILNLLNNDVKKIIMETYYCYIHICDFKKMYPPIGQKEKEPR